MVWNITFLLLLCTSFVWSDVYLHSLRGSNNRLNEKSANRKNANRMFDSQNNNRGGYNVGDATADAAGNDADKQYLMQYFMSSAQAKSYVDIEWTNQHGCGGNENDDPHKQNCNLVLQYMCQEENSVSDERDKIRPGTSTQTQDHTALNGNNVNTETEGQKRGRKNNNVKSDRGVNEPWEWYDKCQIRERNKGLFTADQKLKNNNGQGTSSAIYTRQNPNGNRYGYECPEERDYFPYWHPTPWIDIAVLTDNTSLCRYYQENSFNRNHYGECIEKFPGGNVVKHYSKYNNPESCTAEPNREWVEFENYMEIDTTAKNKAQCVAKSSPTLRYTWGIPFDPSRGSIVPACLVQPQPIKCEQAPWSRSNHLGNGRTGQANSYRWELPSFPSGSDKRCVLRMRYNISTDDYAPWSTNSSFNKDLKSGAMSPVEQNPYVNIGADVTALRLAINTAQFGRTFQDRSHPFILKSRPSEATTQNIYNINVRGKRGNIVQVYPAVEYDFVPNTLEISEGDLVHFQWTGSNTHNNGNPGGDGQTGDAGEGKGGTDKSNVVQIADLSENFPLPYDQTTLWTKSEVVWSEYKVKNVFPSGEDVAVNMASSGYYQCMKQTDCRGNSVETKAVLNNLLNNAPASYYGPLLKVKKGTYHYTCTRNNNFTNRSQKATIIVN